MTKPNKNRWLTPISLLITVILLFWAWRGISLEKVWTILIHLHWGWVGLALVAFLSGFMVRVHRWGLLLAATNTPVRFYLRMAALFIGFGGNCVLPANAGEFLRAGVMRRYAQIPFSTALGSILAERLLDATSAFCFLVIALFSLTGGRRESMNQLPVVWVGLILGVIGLSFVLATFYPDAIAKVIGKLLHKIGLGKMEPSITQGISGILKGLEVLRSPQRLFFALTESLGAWALGGVSFWALMQALEINTPGYLGALFVQSVQAMAIIIPSSPGHLGAFEAAMRFALGVYRIPADVAIAYILIARLMMYGTITTMGLYFAFRLGLTKADWKSR